MSHLFALLARYVIRLTGTVGVLWGVAYMINGITQVPAGIAVRVTPSLESGDHLRLGGRELPAGVRLDDGDLSLYVEGSTVAEQVLSRADVLVSGLCMGVAALLLIALLNSFARGRPFQRGNPARIAWLAVLVTVSGCASVLPGIAEGIVIDRVGLAGTFRPSSGPSWVPVVGAVLLFALALAFREGAKGPRAPETPETPEVPAATGPTGPTESTGPGAGAGTAGVGDPRG
ncbi:hypothetical protein ACIBCT_32480 [Streptosporangium sp. NPDC050855]|uniref:hypothetical protein n=1 Tax=Streptosporangium sp. NPDC050855 TaxID=3366194 RepID=UPI0037A9EDBE